MSHKDAKVWGRRHWRESPRCLHGLHGKLYFSQPYRTALLSPRTWILFFFFLLHLHGHFKDLILQIKVVRFYLPVWSDSVTTSGAPVRFSEEIRETLKAAMPWRQTRRGRVLSVGVWRRCGTATGRFTQVYLPAIGWCVALTTASVNTCVTGRKQLMQSGSYTSYIIIIHLFIFFHVY